MNDILKILTIVMLIGLGLVGASLLALAQFWGWLTSSGADEHRGASLASKQRFANASVARFLPSQFLSER
jgi:hypothetical protein